MSYTLADFERILINAARNAGVDDGAGSPTTDGEVYKQQEKLDAVIGILNDFARRTWRVRGTISVSLAQDDNQVTISGTGFDPLRIVRTTIDSDPWATATIVAGAVTAVTVNRSLVYTSAPSVTFSGGNGTGATATATLTLGRVTAIAVTAAGSGYTETPDVLLNGSRVNYDPTDPILYGPTNCNLTLKRCDIGEINEQIRRFTNFSGTPYLIAFDEGDFTSATVFPKPKADGTLTLVWSPPFVLASNATTTSATVNLPDDMAAMAVRLGGPCLLQAGLIEDVSLEDRNWQKYLSHVKQNMGVGGTTASLKKETERAADW